MARSYLLGIDIGTSACKTALFDVNGGVIAQTACEYQVYYPQPGWAEQNPEDWWLAVCRAVREVIESSGISSGDIAGVGVDGQSWSAVAVDSEGNVLANTPIWMDTRADEFCRRWSEEIGEKKIFNLSGNPLKPSYTTPKAAWYKKYLPDVYERTDKLLQSNSFIVLRLTGKMSQDKSQGYGWHCFDVKNCSWDTDMCLRFGLKPEHLPPIYDCHSVVGGVTANAAELTGLKAGTPVVAGGLDAACGALGAGVINAGDTQEQGGQAGGMSICSETPLAEERLILSPHVVSGKWLLQGGTVGGGGLMRWMSREIGEAFSMKELDSMAEEISPGSDGLVFLPYMAGERSPIWDKDAQGMLFGLDFSKTKGHIIRAGLEGVAFSLKHNLDIAESVGARAETLKAMGGAANSRLWTQIKADITGRRIEVPSSDTATTLGAAILAGVGTGVYSGFDEAVKKTVETKRVHNPNSENAEIYKRQYEKYLKLYPALKDLMRKGN